MGSQNPRRGLNDFAYCESVQAVSCVVLTGDSMFAKIKSVALRVSEKVSTFAVGACALVMSGIASAQSVDPFDAALTTATTKVGAYAAALVGLAAVSVVFMIGLKYVKKLPRAA